MKKALLILFAISVCFSLAACSSSEQNKNTQVQEQPAVLEYPQGITNAPMQAGGMAYDYQTVTSQWMMDTLGHVMITDYTVEPSEKEGHVIKTVHVRFLYSDENARSDGAYSYIYYFDRYDTIHTGKGEANSFELDGYENGGTLTVLQDEFTGSYWQNGVLFVPYVLSIECPQDYNDYVLSFVNSRTMLDLIGDGDEIPDGTPYTDVFDEDTQWFILGDIGSDWESTYVPEVEGYTYEAQESNVHMNNLLEAAYQKALEEWDPEGEAQPPIPFEELENNNDQN